MYHLKFTSEYKRAYKRMKKRGANLALLDDVVDRLRRGEVLEALSLIHISEPTRPY